MLQRVGTGEPVEQAVATFVENANAAAAAEAYAHPLSFSSQRYKPCPFLDNPGEGGAFFLQVPSGAGHFTGAKRKVW